MLEWYVLYALQHDYDYDYDDEYDYVYNGLRPIFIILTAIVMAMITFPFHPVVGVWEVLCSAASTGIKEGPSPFPRVHGRCADTTPAGHSTRGGDHIPRVTYFHIYTYL